MAYFFWKTAKMLYNITMENVKSAKKQKKRGFLKKLIFIVLFIVLLPFMIIGYSIKFIVDNKRKRKWEEKGLRGKALIINTEIENIDKMHSYEFENYLKTLFFYDEYSVNEINDKKDNLFFVSKNNIKSLVCFVESKKQTCSKQVLYVIKQMKKYAAGQAFFVSNSNFSVQATEVAKINNVLLIDRDKLVEMQSIVKQKLSLTTKKEDLIDKFDIDISDKFPNLI